MIAAEAPAAWKSGSADDALYSGMYAAAVVPVDGAQRLRRDDGVEAELLGWVVGRCGNVDALIRSPGAPPLVVATDGCQVVDADGTPC